MRNKRLFWTRALGAIALGLAFTAVRAAPAGSADEALERNARAALHQKAIDGGIRVQVNDGVVYLYGRTSTRPQRVDVETAVREAVPGHRVVSAIEDSPVP